MVSNSLVYLGFFENLFFLGDDGLLESLLATRPGGRADSGGCRLLHLLVAVLLQLFVRRGGGGRSHFERFRGPRLGGGTHFRGRRRRSRLQIRLSSAWQNCGARIKAE